MFSDYITLWREKIIKPYVESNVTETVIENIFDFHVIKNDLFSLMQDNVRVGPFLLSEINGYKVDQKIFVMFATI